MSTPEQRYRAAVRLGKMPWRPNSKVYRLTGAITEARMPMNATLIFHQMIWADRQPVSVADLIESTGCCAATVGSALKHLAKHGWVTPSGAGWAPLSGLDCDCPARPARRSTHETDSVVRPGCVALYRLYGAEDALLYVGITEDLRGRMDQHRRGQPWWPDVMRRTVAWYTDRDAADKAETLAIAAEKPLHNKAKLYAPTAAMEF